MLIYFKIVVIFNITSTDFVLMSADVVLKMTTILKEMRVKKWTDFSNFFIDVRTI